MSTTSWSRSAAKPTWTPSSGGSPRSSARSPTCCAAQPRTMNSTSSPSMPSLDTQAVVWLRAWFRYLRQTGCQLRPGRRSSTRCAARPPSTRALIDLFDAAHDPAARDREHEAERRRSAIPKRARRGRRDRRRPHPAPHPRASSRRPCAPTPSRPPAPKRWPSSSTAPRCRACRRRCPGARSGSTARASRASICAAARSRAAACAGPTGATISAPRSSA